VWTGTGLSFTGTPTGGTYIKHGREVVFTLNVTMTNVLAFGTGQYALSLPVLPLSGGANTFIGTLDLGNGTTYTAIATAASGSAVLNLTYIGANGIKTALTGTAPVTLNTGCSMSFNGAYVADV
jgi:hypothetical protein